MHQLGQCPVVSGVELLCGVKYGGRESHFRTRSSFVVRHRSCGTPRKHGGALRNTAAHLGNTAVHCGAPRKHCGTLRRTSETWRRTAEHCGAPRKHCSTARNAAAHLGNMAAHRGTLRRTSETRRRTSETRRHTAAHSGTLRRTAEQCGAPRKHCGAPRKHCGAPRNTAAHLGNAAATGWSRPQTSTAIALGSLGTRLVGKYEYLAGDETSTRVVQEVWERD